MAPSITVFMPVYNAQSHLVESIESVLRQTWTDFEFVIVDDGSTDATPDILKEWAGRDRRIRLAGTGERIGQTAASNLGVQEARASLCARMDADDVSHPDRLRREIEVFRGDPSVCLVGTLGIGVDSSGRRVRPLDRWRLLRRSPLPPFAHASIMFARAAFLEAGGYRETFGIANDTDMIIRLSRRGRVLILPEPLYNYRFHSESATVANPKKTIDAVDAFRESLPGRRGVPKLPAAGRERHAETLYYLAAMRVWAGERPDDALMTGGGPLPWSGTGLKLRTLLVCARRSPSCARSLLRFFISFRDRLAGLFLRDGRPVEWRFE